MICDPTGQNEKYNVWLCKGVAGLTYTGAICVDKASETHWICSCAWAVLPTEGESRRQEIQSNERVIWHSNWYVHCYQLSTQNTGMHNYVMNIYFSSKSWLIMFWLAYGKNYSKKDDEPMVQGITLTQQGHIRYSHGHKKT